MNYYKISLIGSPLGEFTYKSTKSINHGTLVDIKIKNREVKGVVISTTEEPEFDTSEILEIGELYFSEQQMKLAKFISAYYICSLGDAFSIMTAFENSDESSLCQA